MLVVKVELHNANTGEVSEIGRVVIANDDTGTLRTGNYDVKQRDGEPNNAAIWTQPDREGRVEGHSRLTEPVWSLVAKALKSVGFGG